MSLLGNSFPVSYNDPLYATLAHAAEAQYGLPSGILDAIRTQGERSNANQVSSAGARGPYQFIPSTRQGFIQQYAIDPWADPKSQTNAAALHLLADHDKTGSWDEAIARYNGGTRPPPSSYRYAAKVGDFDNGASTMPPYYQPALPPSLFPVRNGVDPLAPEPPQQPVPITNSPAPSTNVPATSPVAAKKRGGILGALESVFMPDPGSRWAGALRDGLFNAKESQQNYLTGQAQKTLDLATANQKLLALQQHGQFQVVGNNVFHIKPDGTTEMITGPSTLDDKVKLIDKWNSMSDADPAKKMVAALIYGGEGNTPEEIASKNATTITAAKMRAGATTGAATIRANSTNKPLPPLPPGFKVVK